MTYEEANKLLAERQMELLVELDNLNKAEVKDLGLIESKETELRHVEESIFQNKRFAEQAKK